MYREKPERTCTEAKVVYLPCSRRSRKLRKPKVCFSFVNYAKSSCNWIIENSEWIVSHTNTNAFSQNWMAFIVRVGCCWISKSSRGKHGARQLHWRQNKLEIFPGIPPEFPANLTLHVTPPVMLPSSTYFVMQFMSFQRTSSRQTMKSVANPEKAPFLEWKALGINSSRNVSRLKSQLPSKFIKEKI